ncbi:barstar family protein [Gulosibacter faecalis]|uniref:Barstar family protein n=1 Tax=Gulosibacter faecalis TaxID=272240 RepID=A0ABW5V084_9MICO|nr:barstar family protein [Gulosibacter faecalis]
MFEVELRGAVITDIESLYDELNRGFMQHEDWQLGQSLDALDDLLYGGIGDAVGHDRIRVTWRDHERSRARLGAETTASWYEAKLARPGAFNVDKITRDLAALRETGGPTYFDLVLEVFAGHDNVELVLA